MLKSLVPQLWRPPRPRGMDQAASRAAAVPAGNGGGPGWASDDNGGDDRRGIGHEQESRKTSTALVKSIREHMPFFDGSSGSFVAW